MEKAKQVGIWIRVSTEDQAKGESPEHHEKRARYYAESKGWDVREIYHLEAVSGKSVMNHPEAQRMIDDIRTGHITGLIFSKLARLARNTKELLEFSEIFKKYDADLISLQESIDTSTPAGRLFYTMIAAMAQWEREEISERIAASVPIRAKLGKPLSGKAPFGYHWVDKHMVPEPNEAPVRKLMYELFLKHRRKKVVADILNEAGYRSRNGVKFSDVSVNRLLRDSTAKGVLRANYTRRCPETKGIVLKPKEDWVYTEVEPVVSEELWEECNRIMEEYDKKRKRPAKKTVHLFSGIAFCDCGNKMYVPSNSPKYTCRKCRNKIGIPDLEVVYHEQLKEFFFSPEDISCYLSQADQSIKEKEALLKSQAEEEQKLKQEIDAVYRLYIDERIDGEGFEERYKPLEEQRKQINNQIPELEAEIDFLKVQYTSSDQILHEARNIYSRWSELSQEEKRDIVESITERIVVEKDEVIINLCYLPSSSEVMAKCRRSINPSI